MSIVSVGDNLAYNVDRNTGEVKEVHNDCTYEQREKDLQAAEEAQERAMKEYRASPYDNFAQMNLQHTKSWIALTKKDHIAAEILWFIIDKADRYNAVVCSAQVLSEALGYSRVSIHKAIKILKESGFIDIKKSGTTNVYLINRELTWKSWGSNYKYAEFGAKIIISANEQEESIDVKNKKVNMITVCHASTSNKKSDECPSGIAEIDTVSPTP